MPAPLDRTYLQHRAMQELLMTLRADGTEAELAHNALTKRYLHACIHCAEGNSAICADCPLRLICVQEADVETQRAAA